MRGLRRLPACDDGESRGTSGLRVGRDVFFSREGTNTVTTAAANNQNKKIGNRQDFRSQFRNERPLDLVRQSFMWVFGVCHRGSCCGHRARDCGARMGDEVFIADLAVDEDPTAQPNRRRPA